MADLVMNDKQQWFVLGYSEVQIKGKKIMIIDSSSMVGAPTLPLLQGKKKTKFMWTLILFWYLLFLQRLGAIVTSVRPRLWQLVECRINCDRLWNSLLNQNKEVQTKLNRKKEEITKYNKIVKGKSIVYSEFHHPPGKI